MSKKRFGKLLKTGVRAVAAYYTGGASEAMIARAKAAKASAQSGSGEIALPAVPEEPMLPAIRPRQFVPRQAGEFGEIGPERMQMAALPGAGIIGPSGRMSTLYSAGRIVGVGAAAATRQARMLYESAARYCRTHPGWCQGIGGLAAVEALIRGGQLPVHRRRRRGRGISAREFRSFHRVHKLLSTFCAPRMKVRRGARYRGERRSSPR